MTLLPDPVRLAVGTFTVVRVPPPRRVDRGTARGALLLSPYVGLVVVVPSALALYAARTLPLGTAAPWAADLLGSALAVALLALLTRGLHLDGLADVVDGLGVKGADDGVRPRRLDVMRQPDVGAFGAAALVLVLVVDVAALAACAATGRGTAALVLVGTVPRLAVVWSCTPRVPSARPDGLGAAVAGSVPVVAAAASTAVVGLMLVGAGLLDGDAGGVPVDLLLAGAVGLLCGGLVLRRCLRALGGITGDVLGAVLEASAAACLVALALLA